MARRSLEPHGLSTTFAFGSRCFVMHCVASVGPGSRAYTYVYVLGKVPCCPRLARLPGEYTFEPTQHIPLLARAANLSRLRQDPNLGYRSCRSTRQRLPYPVPILPFHMLAVVTVAKTEVPCSPHPTSRTGKKVHCTVRIASYTVACTSSGGAC